MGFYAQRRGRAVGQLFGDLSVVVWVVLWAVVGLLVDRAVSLLAGPARQAAATARQLSSDFSGAAGQAGQVPGLGEQLRQPFDSASGSLGGMVATADAAATTIDHLAALLGWLTFLLPVAVALALWLPRRIRFYRLARATAAFLDSSADLDLFALRAMASQPMPVLAAISPDPVGAWRAGDRGVIARLAELELARSGLHVPPQLQPADDTAAR